MKNRIFYLGAMALSAMAFVNCSDNDSQIITDPNSALYTGVLTDLTTDVITSTYADMNTNALALKVAVNALTIGDEAALTAVKNSWKATRAPWEQSEGFLYGPVETGGIDPAMDTWPVNVNDLNPILAGSAPITVEVVEANTGIRGFHLIEYLAWGINGNKTASDLTAREIEYMKAASIDLQNNTQRLYDGWKTNGGNFGVNFINAGQGGATYVSQKDALEEVVNGIIGIANEVSTSKLADPFQAELTETGTGVTFEESRFSNNSKTDFANNMKSIQNIYLGDFNGSEKRGLTDIVAPANSALDAEIRTAIEDAITSINDIPVSFGSSLSNNHPAIENAIEKTLALKILLENQLSPFIANN